VVPSSLPPKFLRNNNYVDLFRIHYFSPNIYIKVARVIYWVSGKAVETAANCPPAAYILSWVLPLAGCSPCATQAPYVGEQVIRKSE